MIPQGYPLWIQITEHEDSWTALVVGWKPGNEARTAYVPVAVAVGANPAGTDAAVPVRWQQTWRIIPAPEGW